jgi:hypothetical protein
LGSKKQPLKQHTINSDIPLAHLKVSPAQLEPLKAMYRGDATAAPDGNLLVDFLYKLDDDGQLSASAIMAQQALDIGARESLDNRWAINWSRSSGKSPKAEGQTWRELLLWYVFKLSPKPAISNHYFAAAAVMIIITIARNIATVPYPSLHVLLMQKSPMLLIPIKSSVSAGIFTTTTRARTPNLHGFRASPYTLLSLQSHFPNSAMVPRSQT